MPYSAAHRQRVKERIVDSARRQFNRHGFDGVSINQVMAGAQLTHGSFYRYFASKSDLYAEVLACFFTQPDWKNCWEGIQIDMTAAVVGPQIVRAYLSQQHFDDVGNSCPMVALPSDVARSGKSARNAFETVFKAMVGILERGARDTLEPRRTTSQAVAALCVGGMVVARAMADRSLADELRASCMAVALRMGGWSEPVAASVRPSKRNRAARVHAQQPRGAGSRRAGPPTQKSQ